MRGVWPFGEETDAGKAVCEELSKYARVRIDQNGNVIGEMGNPASAKHILLDAHLDQIGLVVTSIDEAGFLKTASCGGVDSRALIGNAVTVCGKKPLTGIVCCTPPHLSKGGEDKVPPVEELYIDVGLSGEQARQMVAPGDRVLFAQQPRPLLGDKVTAPALDNRAGVACLIRCAQLLAQEELPCRVTILCSAQEETGCAGALTGSFALEPDEAVIVDVSFGTQPGVALEKSGRLGEGPMIGIAASLSKPVCDRLIQLAKENDIPYQLEVMGGSTGTNADVIGVSRKGVRCGIASIPLRNMHTPVEVIDLRDVEQTARLLACYVRKGGLCDG